MILYSALLSGYATVANLQTTDVVDLCDMFHIMQPSEEDFVTMLAQCWDDGSIELGRRAPYENGRAPPTFIVKGSHVNCIMTFKGYIREVVPIQVPEVLE